VFTGLAVWVLPKAEQAKGKVKVLLCRSRRHVCPNIFTQHLRIAKEGHNLRIFENMVRGKMFWSERKKLMREWRKMHSEELYDSELLIQTKQAYSGD
jgi:hypothetical protein